MRMSVKGFAEVLSIPNELPRLRSQIQRGAKVLLALHRSVQAIVVGMFFFFAVTKLVGSAEARAFFNEVGWGPWFRYFCSGVELLGAGLLLVPRTWWFGWGVLVADTISTIVLRTLVVHKDAFAWMQVLGALSLLAALPRPGAVRALANRVSANGAGR